jgi:hypothetical protein
VLLFQKRFHAGLVSGAVTITFRRWDKPHVRVGGRYRCHPIGVLEVDRVEKVAVRSITEADAIASGFVSRVELVGYLQSAREETLAEDDEVFRVALHHGGDGDRVELALETDLSAEDVAAITKKLARLDDGGAWTRKTIALIDRLPRVAASQLAAKLGRETLPFKVDVRKLKKLGLTQSFEVGYEISPRGRAFLEAEARARTTKKPTSKSQAKKRATKNQ